jgi:hypothetical protein
MAGPFVALIAEGQLNDPPFATAMLERRTDRAAVVGEQSAFGRAKSNGLLRGPVRSWISSIRVRAFTSARPLRQISSRRIPVAIENRRKRATGMICRSSAQKKGK